MMKRIGITLTIVGLLAVVLLGCGKPVSSQAPVHFDVTGLVTRPDASNTNAMKITGVLRARDGALSSKAVLLTIGGKVSFERSGVTKPFFAANDHVLVTNGTGMLELWFFVSPTERKAIESELTAAAYVFESQGYTELKPTSLESR